jgi:transcriptional regulator with XRE-family HTH domain
MFDIGASLREARTRRGLSLDDVTSGLRIRERYVTALEEERWELMPAEAYTKGFLRMYAEFLGLNGTLYLDEYNERFAAQDDEPFIRESLAPAKTRHRLLFRTIIAIATFGAAVAALNLFGSGGTSATHVANAAPPRKAAAQVVTPATPVKQIVTRKPTVASIRAVASRSWLSVRIGNASGKEIFRGFLDLGHSLTYGLHTNVWLRIGRPQALTIRIGPHLVGGLPGTPANLLLTPDGPRAG